MGTTGTTVTVRLRTLATAALVAMALVVAFLLGAAGEGAPAEAAEESEPPQDQGTLTMVGSGEATVVPDQVAFTLAVHVTRDDLEDSLDTANRTLDRVLGALAEHGVERRDVQTTGLSMEPVYDYPSSGPPVLRGYRVSERATVLVRELRQAGAAISTAVATGGNAVRVGGIRLQVGDADEALARARQAAVEEATTKAEEYAAAAGQSLGEVVTLREVGERQDSALRDRVVELSAYRAAADLAAVPIRTGRDELGVKVQVVWRFE